MGWFWTAISAFLFLWILQEFLTLKKKKKRPPGPIGLPILGHFHLFGKNPHRDLYHLARKHGPIMCLQMGSVPTIVISSPAAAELVLKTHDLVFAGRPKSQAGEYISYGQRDLVFSSYGPYWRNMRKFCTLQLLSNHKINQFQPMRRAELQIMINTLKGVSREREVVDISANVSGLVGDMTCLMVFGRKYEDRVDFDEKGFKAVIEETMEEVGRFNVGDYFPYLRFLDLQGSDRRLKKFSKIFDAFFERIIDDHLQNKNEKSAQDFVDTMMAFMESGEAGFEFDRRHVKALLWDMLIGGLDTSATAIDWTLSELLRHPRVMKKLQQELEMVIGMDQMVEEHDLDKLEYLDCVLSESFRVHPPAPFLQHESLEDCTLDGFHVPKETQLIINVFAINRDADAWTDPERFIPERFLEKDIDLRGRDFQLIPFGSGRRGCPGLQLGLTVVRLVVAQLVHCFDWELPNGMLPNELDMSEKFGLMTGRANHLMATPSYRLHQ